MVIAQVCLLAVAVAAVQSGLVPVTSNSKFVIDASVLGQAGHEGLQQGIQINGIQGSSGFGEHHEYDHHGYPQYAFDYGVSDKHTGDHKNQHETRNGDHVVGQYSLLEPDGVHRVVKYSADKSGFYADVQRDGASQHPHAEYGIQGHSDEHGHH